MTHREATRSSAAATAGALLRAAHPVPAAAVTVLTALLAAGSGLGPGRALLVTAAVGTGQLTIGWTNDLLDADRDRQVGRTDKPVAGGEVSEVVVRRAVAGTLALCVVLSLACGPASAALNVLLGAGSGWAYNLVLKRTVWSAVPYALAFGSLPAVVSTAAGPSTWPPFWAPVAGALLGVGAHLLNVLPDLADDARTGVRGLPHRLGGRSVRVLAPLVLLAGALAALLGPWLASAPAADRPAAAWTGGGLLVCVALAGVALVARGRTPFLAAIGIALVVVVSLVAGT